MLFIGKQDYLWAEPVITSTADAQKALHSFPLFTFKCSIVLVYGLTAIDKLDLVKEFWTHHLLKFDQFDCNALLLL